MDDSSAGEQRLRIKPGTKLISIGVGDLYIRANYQDFERYQPVDIAIGADAEATLPMLTEYVKQAIPADRRAMIAARGDKAKKGHGRGARAHAAAAAAKTPGMRARSAPSRLSAEMWNQIKNENWALVSRDSSPSNWPHRLWKFDQHHQFIGGPGGAGIGYGLPAAVGASFAHQAGRRPRSASTSRTTATPCMRRARCGRPRITSVPMLTVMWNNRAYHQEIMHVQRMANWRQRDVSTAHIGTTIWDPYVQLREARGRIGPCRHRSRSPIPKNSARRSNAASKR